MEHFPIFNNLKVKKNLIKAIKQYFIKLFSKFLKKFNLNFFKNNLSNKKCLIRKFI
jgi:hypothetical protein